MANNIVQSESNRLLDASFGTASFTAPTTPMKLALTTANGSATAAGTEVTGGSYTRQTMAMAAASAGSASNSGTISFTSMPAATVVGVEVYDSAGSPRRTWWGALTAPKTVGAGDSLTFAPSSLSASIQ
ncbi:hypothetical protein ACH4T9_12585 [Micromonospora sp. NPDC020750]|uniref:phage tail fiber protein n=1 Tax=unclassified Micromonospora TaxID=2617518 RepID=UPI0037AEC581